MKLYAGDMDRNTICLVLICRNEENFIVPCLESVEKWIDYYIILDSESDDETVFLAQTHLDGAGIPGQIVTYTKPLHAGEKRTAAMQLARDKADYLLMIDCDNILQVEGDPFHDLTEECYYITKQLEGVQYPVVQLFRGDLDWKFTGIAHEYPELVGSTDPYLKPGAAIPGVIVHEASKAVGPRARNPRQYYGLALLMEKEIFDNLETIPMHLRHRYTFYIAMGYKDAIEYDRAINVFLYRVKMGGWAEEIWYSLYMIAKIRQVKNEDLLKVIDAYTAAWNYRPQRLEAAYALMQIYIAAKFFHMAIAIGEQALKHQPCTDMLFLEYDLYNGKFLELFDSITQKEVANV